MGDFSFHCTIILRYSHPTGILNETKIALVVIMKVEIRLEIIRGKGMVRQPATSS